MRIKMRSNEIPLFFATDDNYLPYMAVALRSIIDNASNEYDYKVYVLIDELSDESRKAITDMCRDNFSAEFVSVAEQLSQLSQRLHLRDYYTKATYYRFFIPEMFPQYDKGLYLDCDIAVTGDISKLYETRLGTNLVGAVTDEVITDIPVFRDYAEKFLGIEAEKYFNAGILVMNLREMRRTHIENKLSKLMKLHTFRVAQDQDYLNVICYGKVKYLSGSWNKTPFPNSPREKLPMIAHYKINFKPWHYEGVVYEEVFWEYAKKTEFYECLLSERAGYNEEKRRNDTAQYEGLKALAESEIKRAGRAVMLPASHTFLLTGVI